MSCGCLAAEMSAERKLKTGISYDRKSEAFKKYQRECYDRFKYNLEPAEKQAMLDAQNGRCVICGYKFGQEVGDTNVDHDHGTGEVRGLLCDLCNRGIGYFKDDADRMRRAADYVIKTARAR